MFARDRESRPDERLLAFYGDDFTGSTDAMDALSRSGVRTVLFLEPPSPETLESEAADAEAVGVAGTSRAMTPAEMDEALPPAFERLAELEAPFVHYKVCSTFDSSPEVGSIGRAIEIADEVFENDSVPVLPGAPPLGRYVAFGNMFARDEVGVHRLDRHPTMSEHPVTPMSESDLLRHLSRQTDASMALVDARAVQKGREAAERRLRDRLEERPDVVFFDTLDEEDLRTVGELLWEMYATGRTRGTGDGDGERTPTFAVGSSGVEYALADYWRRAGVLDREARFEALPAVERTLVVSGSAAPATATQISTALEAGFAGVRLDTAALVDPEAAGDERERAKSTARSALDDGTSVVLYAARGADDPAVEETNRAASELSDAPENVGAFLAEEQGRLLRELLEETGLKRVCVAGGDTCGRVAPAVDVYALRSRYPLAPGAPLCEARSRTDAFDGLEIALKGGQLGGEDYFVRVRDGAESWRSES